MDFIKAFRTHCDDRRNFRLWVMVMGLNPYTKQSDGPKFGTMLAEAHEKDTGLHLTASSRSIVPANLTVCPCFVVGLATFQT